MNQLAGFFWFVLMLAPLIFLQRLLHRELQAVFLIATRSARFTIGLFQLIFLPGVFLHESSHYLMAKVLRVPTGRFSVLPRPLPNGRLQMGYVEIARSDIARDSLIGAAPLIVGTLFTAYVAVYALDMRVLWDTLRNGQMSMFWMGINALPTVNNFYLWAYLAFVVSSMMMPSQSDRHAWLELVISVSILFVVALLVGAGPWMLTNVAPAVSDFLSSVAVIFGLSAAVHGILALPVMLLHKLLARFTGTDVR
ncbi:MAG: hypothetical protein IPM31_11005 [Anaerolineae bacterium]|nr:hypothetical protein [Anaerolineae bacterium]MBL8104050.1 hypothetical protein [Anaerolineales bacterium]HQU36002.1 hypothetical protein [Anaerolineales bacterium]